MQSSSILIIIFSLVDLMVGAVVWGCSTKRCSTTAHDVLLPVLGVLMISDVIVAGVVVKAESNNKNQFFSRGRDKYKYTLVGRYWFRR